MSSYYSNTVVDVTVNAEDAPSELQSYSNVLALVAHNLSSNTIDAVTAVSDVQDLGCATNSPLYEMVTGMFSGGNYPPDYANIARVTPDTFTITVTAIPDVGDDIEIYANVAGTESTISYTIATGNGTEEAAAGLEAALLVAYPSATTGNPTFTVSGSVITITPSTFTCDFGWSTATSNLPHVTIAATTSDSLASIATAALAEDDDVSFIISQWHEETEVSALASWAESNSMQYFTSTQDTDVASSSVTDDIASNLVALSYDNTSIMYTEYADTYFAEAYFLGWYAGLNPYDLYNPNAWTLSGLPISSLSTTQKNALSGKNCNFYITRASKGWFTSGWAVNGRFVDSVRFCIWFKTETVSTLTSLLYNKSNAGSAVPYSDAGASMMEARVTSNVINVGIKGGRIANETTTDSDGNVIDLKPVVDFGTRGEQTDSNISNRIWSDVTISVVMYSGINYIENLNVYVQLNRDADA